MSRFEEEVYRLVEASSHGKGWWYNIDTQQLFPIDSGSLGPNGDHDGWISIGDNAEKLGVDPYWARAFQDATYGFMVDENSPFHEFADEWGYVNPQDIDLERMREFQDLFAEEYDFDIDDVFGVTSDYASHLIRIRLWPDGFMSISSNGDNMTRELWPAIRDLRSQLEREGALTPLVKQISLSDDTGQHNYTISREDFLSAHNARDLGMS